MEKKRLLDIEQTRRLANYAAKEIIKMGDNIAMEDTGNLLDSLCWGLWFKGRLVHSGYYRNPAEAFESSYIHAISPMPPKELVNGRYLAQLFLSEYQPKQKNGWEVVWAATAPYYAYWEYGLYNVFYKQKVQFRTVAERYDHIKATLEPPCRVQFLIELPIY